MGGHGIGYARILQNKWCNILIKSLFLVVFIIACVSFIPKAFSESEKNATQWDGIILHQAEEQTLEKAKKCLLLAEFISDAKSIPESKVYFACQRNNLVIVWYGKNTGELSYVCVYSPEGQFKFGYKLHFTFISGVFNIYADNDNELWIFVSRANCIYYFTSNSVNYYYAPPRFTGRFYTHNKEKSTPGFSVTYTENDVTVHKGQQEYLIFHREPPEKSYDSLILAFILLIVLCAFVYLMIRI